MEDPEGREACRHVQMAVIAASGVRKPSATEDATSVREKRIRDRSAESLN